MKYKVGDKVRVRKDLVVDKRYGIDVFTEGMKKYSGKTMTVVNIISTGKYEFKEDNKTWSWTDEMLENVENINIIVDGNKVIAKRGNKVGIAKCSPEDDFDIFTGVRIAIDKLEEKYKPYGWLKKDAVYYYPNVLVDDLYDCYTYYNDHYDKILKSRGLVFKTKEEAIECAKKMLEVVK